MSRDITRTPVIRRTLVASAATVATALILTPASAFAAGGGPGGGKPSPHPAGPVQTTTKIVPPKMLVSTKALTISAHVSPARRGFGTPAESGTVVCERCEIADSMFARTRGLLGRSGLDPGGGMLIERS